MTGFGRASAQAENCAITCEIKSVNGRGLDVRSRISPGFEKLEADIRRIVSDRLTRGSVSVFLNVRQSASNARLVINEEALESVLEVIERLGDRIDASKPSIEAILALKGVADTEEPDLSGEAERKLNATVLGAVSEALDALGESRAAEGRAIGETLAGQLDQIEALAKAAEDHPARTREAILEKLRQQIAVLMEAEKGFSEDRLHQEALMLATKADIREELDRFSVHTKAARQLLAKGGPVGRKLDFLSQEFNREANTLCSKSNDVGLTAIGLDLKAVIDQVREQVQNLE